MYFCDFSSAIVLFKVLLRAILFEVSLVILSSAVMEDGFNCWIFMLFLSKCVLQFHLYFTNNKNFRDSLICPVFPTAATVCHCCSLSVCADESVSACFTSFIRIVERSCKA